MHLQRKVQPRYISVSRVEPQHGKIEALGNVISRRQFDPTGKGGNLFEILEISWTVIKGARRGCINKITVFSCYLWQCRMYVTSKSESV